jgi:DNA-binding NarL/FixJ family response regulator
MVEPIRVLIVDDQPRARQSMKALLATLPQIKEIREAANGREALQRIEESLPDVVLMDVLMPEMNGLEATRLIKARWHQVRVIVLSMYGEYANEAKAAAADDFISKGEPPARLLKTLAALANIDQEPSNDSAAPQLG